MPDVSGRYSTSTSPRRGSVTVALLHGLSLMVSVSLCHLPDVQGSHDDTYHIPGMAQTLNGYDTEMGTDPICWRSEGIVGDNSTETIYSSYSLLESCPPNNFIEGFAPLEKRKGEWLRTRKEVYNYSASFTLNLSTLGGETELLSDVNDPLTPFRVSVQVLLCKLGATGFCSPFVHDVANARFAAQNMTESLKSPAGEIHGGTHIHSPAVFFELDPRDGPSYHFTTDIPMLVNVTGQYYAIVALEMSVTNVTSGMVTRYDMASKLSGNDSLVTYSEPPNVLQVPYAVLVVSYVGIALAGSVIMFLLFQTIKHRKNKILKLTQGPFLILFLIAALAATICSFLLEPKNDLYCRIGFPTVLISLQLVFAITIGRLWRINAVISPLLMQKMRREHTWKTRLVVVFRRRLLQLSLIGSMTSLVEVRRTVTSCQLAAVIAVFTLPQVILQILAMMLQPATYTVLLNQDGSEGRALCNYGPAYSSLVVYGVFLFFALVVFLLFLAHVTQRLPSLFNETRVIFQSTISSMVALVVGLGVISVTYSPTTSPGVDYLVAVLIILCLTLNMTWRIIMPKLQMVWSGETVLVSKLVSDHARTMRKIHEPSPDHPQQPLHHVYSSGNTLVSGVMPTSSNTIISGAALDTGEPQESENSVSQNSSLGVIRESPQEILEDAGLSSPNTRRMFDRQSLMERAQTLPSQRQRILPDRRIVVTKEETPARRLVLKMVGLQEQLSSVNERIMSGLAVSEQEWAELRSLSCSMGYIFSDEVKFDWETPEEASREIAYTRCRGSLLRRTISDRSLRIDANATSTKNSFGSADSKKRLRFLPEVADIDNLLLEEDDESDEIDGGDGMNEYLFDDGTVEVHV